MTEEEMELIAEKFANHMIKAMHEILDEEVKESAKQVKELKDYITTEINRSILGKERK